MVNSCQLQLLVLHRSDTDSGPMAMIPHT